MKINWKKQAGDQSVHLFIGIIAVNILSRMIGVWPAGYVVLVFWGIWEARQKNSARLWDPYVDWAFQVIGVGLAVWWGLP